MATVLLAFDLVIVAPAIVSAAVGGIDGFDGGRLDVRFDRTVPEFFGYAQLLFAIGAMSFAGRRDGSRLPLAIAAIGGVVLLDDGLRIHEQVGERVARSLDEFGPIRGEDVGELATWSVLGAVCLVLLLWGLRAASARERSFAAPWLWVPAMLALAIPLDVIGAAQHIEGFQVADDVLEVLALTMAAVLARGRWRHPMRDWSDAPSSA